MTIVDNFEAPNSPNALELPDDPNSTYFIAFISSSDPTTKQPWCPDVRAALPIINAAFSAETDRQLAYVHVGQKVEYVSLLHEKMNLVYLSQ